MESLEEQGLFYGSYKATVEDNEDPDKRGRLKVRCPEIYGDDIHEYWALPKSPYTGKDAGFDFIPEKGDGIWISFEGGDCRFPVWDGGWWVEEAPSGDPKIKVLKTSIGCLKFDLKNKYVEVEGSGNYTRTTDKEISMVAPKISLGKQGEASYKAVKGDTNVNLIDSLITAILAATVNTSFGPSSTVINSVQFQAVKEQLNTMLSEVVTLE